jgi:hypothetical protein
MHDAFGRRPLPLLLLPPLSLHTFVTPLLLDATLLHHLHLILFNLS